MVLPADMKLEDKKLTQANLLTERRLMKQLAEPVSTRQKIKCSNAFVRWN